MSLKHSSGHSTSQLKNLQWLSLPTKWQSAYYILLHPPPFRHLHLWFKKSLLSKNQIECFLLSAAFSDLYSLQEPCLFLFPCCTDSFQSPLSYNPLGLCAPTPSLTVRPSRAGTVSFMCSSSGSIPRQGSEQVIRKFCWVVQKDPMGQMSSASMPLPSWPMPHPGPEPLND